MTELTLKGEKYRIRRADPRNLVIERLQRPKDASLPAIRWEIVGYYGRVEDLAPALLRLAIPVPEEAKSLREFIDLLRQETRQVERNITRQLSSILKRHQLDTTSLQGQETGESEPAFEEVKSRGGK